MGDNPVRREAARPRKEVGANVSLGDGEVTELQHARESHTIPGRARRNSASSVVHQRHMPMDPLKFHIPRKNKQNRDLFQCISEESREYEDMFTILTSSFIDTGSAGCFTYSNPRLVHSELLEKEFVEKRKEMKVEGRTDKELEENHCFLMADAAKLPAICEKGLFVGQSWVTALGNPSKGVYLSKYSDLLQVNHFTPGATGEIIIFKVMKGKVKSIYENMTKNLLDPTPRFDSHISKNASKVTSLTAYRAFELTQQYFYEYSFDELRQRPRQVCPYAVISFHFKGKDSLLPSKPLAPIRLNSQSAEGSKEAQLTVWTGELVKDDRVLFNISLRSSSPPFLPHKLQEKLEIGCLMRFEQVSRLIPSALFSWSLYNSSHEVVKDGHYCSLLEVMDRSRTGTSVTRLLQELESKRLVLVTRLTERGFLLLLSSAQMAAPSERPEGWKRCLQALFVFPESRDLAKSTLRCSSSSRDASELRRSGDTVMPRLSLFLPALHHALGKARANPPAEMSASVERQAREYLSGLNDSTVLQYPMSEYDTKLDERDKLFPAPKHQRANADGYLRAYLYSPALYLLAVARAKQMVETHCGPEEQWDKEGTLRRSRGKQMEPKANNPQKVQSLIDLVLTCKRNAENEVSREEGVTGGHEGGGRKRRLEQETAQRALKYLKASQAPGGRDRIPVEGGLDSASASSVASLLDSLGLRDTDLGEEGSELAAKLLNLLTGLKQAARGSANQSPPEEQKEAKSESCPFDGLATKLGLPTNCDIDLRKQEELEEQTAGSVSSLEGFSPSSHSGEMNHHGGGRLGRSVRGDEEENEEGEIPWVLIPITGLSSERYTQRQRDIPQDPRFLHLAMATDATPTDKPHGRNPTLSPVPSPPHSPIPSPPPSPTQCPSPAPSPPPSPEAGPPLSPSLQSNELIPRNTTHSHMSEGLFTPTASGESAGAARDSTGKTPEKEKNKEPSSLDPERRRNLSTQTTEEQRKEEQEVHEENQSDEAATEAKEEDAAVATQAVDEAACDEERTTPLASQPALPHRDIDSIVKKHLNNFSSEIQQLLQEESVKCSFPHPAPYPETTAAKEPLTPFSLYVSSHNSSPQTQSYVSSLKKSFSSLLIEVDKNWQSERTDVDSALACRVSAYVASIRASNRNVSRDDDDAVAHVSASGNQTTLYSTGGEVRPPNIRSGRSLPHALSSAAVSTPSYDPPADWVEGPSLRGSVYPSTTADTPLDAVLPPPPPPFSGAYNQSQQSDWIPQQCRGLENSRTVAHGTNTSRQTQDNGCSEPSHRTDRNNLAHADCKVTVSAFAGLSHRTVESSQPLNREASPSEAVSFPVPASVAAPSHSPTALSSLISQLQPEVFSNLVEIIKDVKRNSLQFYIHRTQPDGRVDEDIKEYLLKQGNVEQSPVAFLNQEKSTDSRLLVIIKNQDIAAHIHKIPGLVSLKRHPSVVFLGIDVLDDIRNNSYNELFVSGGCIVSDELILNPAFITHERLAALLMLLEQQSSPESVWRWKIHCKTHKRLKEQARFERDAAKVLDILSAYQKRLIVEFLPYHRCDMTNCESPDLECLIELQARYTQYRHTIFLTERRFEMFPKYSSGGIIVASMDEVLHSFTSLVGYHDIKDKQPIKDDLLAPKEKQVSRGDPMLGSERSPSIFPEHLIPSSSGPAPSQLRPLSDQLVPESSAPTSSSSSGKDGTPHSADQDFEALRQAISQLRAERQSQLKQQQTEYSISPLQTFLSNAIPQGALIEQSPLTPSGHTTPPPPSQGGPADQIQRPSGRKAVAATLELIHSALQPEQEEEEEEEETTVDGGEWRKGSRNRRDGTPAGMMTEVPVEGHVSVIKDDSTSPPPADITSSNKAAATRPGDLTQPGNLTRDVTEEVTVSCSTAACTIDGSRTRDKQATQEESSGGEAAPPCNQEYRNAAVTGSIAMVTNQRDALRPPPLPRLQQLQQQIQQHQQQLRQQHKQSQRSAGLLPCPANLSLPFPPAHVLPPLAALGGMRGLLGPLPGGLVPTGAPAVVWGFHQPGRELAGARLVGGYHNAGGQGGNRYGGGQRGGFSSM